MKLQFKQEKTLSSAVLLTLLGLFTSPLQAQATPASELLASSSSAKAQSSVESSESTVSNSPAASTLTAAVTGHQKSEGSFTEASLLQSSEAIPAQGFTNAQKPPSFFNTPSAPAPSSSSNLKETLANPSQPTPVIFNNQVEGDPMSQVNSVTQFRDVFPGDWAYQALSDLVTRYGCIAGYPDGTFRGNRALSRYEFAAGLNACLQQIERILAESTADLATREDLEVLQALMREFQGELEMLGGRIDALDARITFQEDNQFSTTTKLFGQAIIGIQGRDGGTFDFLGLRFQDRQESINVVANAQLSLFTQFSPRSLLLTSFQAGTGSTVDSFAGDRSLPSQYRNFVGLAYEGDTNANLFLSDLNYRHLFGNNLAVMVGPRGISPVNVFRGSNRVESAGSGPLSRFAQRNPISSIGGGQGGIGLDWQISPIASLQAVYSSSDPENSFPGTIFNGGLFGGDYAATTAGLQVVLSPTDDIDVALQYIHSYSPLGLLLTGLGDDQLITSNSGAFLRAPMQTNAFGFNTEWRVTPRFTLGGWVGYSTSSYLPGSGTVETLNWMAFLNFPDLGGQGNLGGLYFGQPPKITSSNVSQGGLGRNIPGFSQNVVNPPAGGQPATSYHLEAFYRLRLTDNISITPGVIFVFNPGHNSRNSTVTIGALRTTFSF
ncbi:iron uptake porin [Spirulina subsalsa FACHB-351]|uniref:Iron uptake porin n=1 Tax=Spirulina subsalsa FACHB-351 TaxID=234711 RepID=A0ABT3L771_9CYAN|nr:iron uptake porin [Spirulina subsalsa]MCW6037353.1 iron uptake porin [Spirulina subsalsa FACHB-351]